MRLKNIPGARERIAESKYMYSFNFKDSECAAIEKSGDLEDSECAVQSSIVETKDEEIKKLLVESASYKNHWNEIFGNENPIRIEIGMGKGAFLMEMARRNPDINFVGIEKFSSVMLRAVEKQDEEELPNVRLIRMDAGHIAFVFGVGEVDRIYLNFSDPWPRAKTAKRRLTSRQFLSKYEKILKPEGLIEFKTDNMNLFDFSLAEARQSNWAILTETKNLHKDKVLNEGNVMTEYEEKFSLLGNPICKMIIRKMA